jgi:phytoene/squalene synthetase
MVEVDWSDLLKLANEKIAQPMSLEDAASNLQVLQEELQAMIDAISDDIDRRRDDDEDGA